MVVVGGTKKKKKSSSHDINVVVGDWERWNYG